MVPESMERYAIAGTRPIELRVGADTWEATLRQWILVSPAPGRRTSEATTSGYAYELRREDATELLLYHWHPGGPSPMQAPHLHLGTELVDALRVATSPHLPTGHVGPPRIHRQAHPGVRGPAGEA